MLFHAGVHLLQDGGRAAHVGVGVGKAIRKAELNTLLSGQPRLRVHHLRQTLLRQFVASLLQIRLPPRSIDDVQVIRRLPQLRGIAAGTHPHVVDHHQGVARHDHFVARHGDHGGDGTGKAVHVHHLPRRVALQLVVDRRSFKDAAAAAVDVDLDARHVGMLRQLLAEVLRAVVALDIPPVLPIELLAFYVTVDVELQDALRSLLDFPKGFPHAFPPSAPPSTEVSEPSVAIFFVR